MGTLWRHRSFVSSVWETLAFPVLTVSLLIGALEIFVAGAFFSGLVNYGIRWLETIRASDDMRSSSLWFLLVQGKWKSFARLDLRDLLPQRHGIPKFHQVPTRTADDDYLLVEYLLFASPFAVRGPKLNGPGRFDQMASRFHEGPWRSRSDRLGL